MALFVSALVTGAAARGEFKAGIPAGAEMALPSHALAASLGPVAQGMCESAGAVGVNPARMGMGRGVTASYTTWPMQLSDTSVAGCTSSGGAGTLGLFVRRLWMSMDRLVENGDGTYGGVNGRADMQATTGGLAWSPDPAFLTDMAGRRTSVGISVAYAGRDLDGASQEGVSGTVGADVELDERLRAFTVARNLGAVSRSALGVEGTVGVVYSTELSGLGTLRTAASGIWGADGGPAGAVGVELAVSGGHATAALRTGYRIGPVKQAGYLPFAGVAVGLGGLSLEMALVPMGEIGTAQVASLTYYQK